MVGDLGEVHAMTLKITGDEKRWFQEHVRCDFIDAEDRAVAERWS